MQVEWNARAWSTWGSISNTSFKIQVGIKEQKVFLGLTLSFWGLYIEEWSKTQHQENLVLAYLQLQMLWSYQLCTTCCWYTNNYEFKCRCFFLSSSQSNGMNTASKHFEEDSGLFMSNNWEKWSAERVEDHILLYWLTVFCTSINIHVLL